MRTYIALGAAALLAGTALAAADKPEIGPAPAWVKPVALPPAGAAAGDAPFRMLLQDQQLQLEAGRQVLYSEVAIRIQTPQGLGAGNISFPWRPDKDVLTVHKLLIRRGDQVIDVLASGQTFTVARRETNMENAALDGVLTANIQPEGLQVGDVLDFAASIATSDPVLKGHVETIGAAWNGIPIGRAHLRMQWPTTLPLRLRPTGAFAALKPVRSGATTSVELSLDNLEPIEPPKGAPQRFRFGRLIEASDFASWSSLAALMAPLYDKAAALSPTGPLQAEIVRIKALSPDPKARAEAALALVQDRVRYVLLAMGDGGLVPADADTTWSRRFGDCKGKTALLLALLHAVDIQAEPVIVSSAFGDGMDQRLPMVGLFDHVLVRATIGGRTYWLDGTRTGDKHLDSIQVPAFGWGLPILASGAALVRMMPAPLDQPTRTEIHIDASAGLSVPAPTRIETVLRGDEALAFNLGLASLTADARDRTLKDYWKSSYDFISVKTVSARYDPAAGEERLAMSGDAKMDWAGGRYETDGTGVGYKADFAREPGPDRDAPFAVPYPFYARTVETILLPPHSGAFAAGANIEVDQTAGGIEYRRHATLAGNVFTIERSQRSIAPEFPAKDAPAAQAALTALAGKTAYLLEPPRYHPTDAEIEAARAATPSDANGFVTRGNMHLDRHQLDEAIADFGRALVLDPKNVWALADRGLSHAWKQETALAKADLDAAAAIDPRNAVVFRARGLLAEQRDAPADAIAAYTTSLDIQPGNSFALIHRSELYRSIGDIDHALADSAAAIKADPSLIELYRIRANLLRSRGQDDLAAAQAAALAAANPDDNYALVVAGRIYAESHKPVEAMHAFDRAIAITPEPYIYLARSRIRAKEDVAGRRADIAAALKLNPKSTDAIAASAKLMEESGDPAGAIAAWAAALAAAPGDPDLLVLRGIAYARAGQAALADKDFAAARAKMDNPVLLNNMCWQKATAGVALQSALDDCNAALGKSPGAAGFLDSRALVLLRLGRLDEAIADYDRALAARPHQPSSLFGRAVAWAKKGDKARSDADAAAAVKADADVRTEFEDYGIRI